MTTCGHSKWSIPACAGEPQPSCPQYALVWVYPRVCGGTRLRLAPAISISGLSPRVRGNHDYARRCAACPRSIPACAGEPVRRRDVGDDASVYPRVCGGTAGAEIRQLTAAGLSPRVRGNLPNYSILDGDHRSIPACAGEPCGRAIESSPRTVYPRVCGGTRTHLDRVVDRRGLSPRVRGNLSGFYEVTLRGGSIPACAGEPLRRHSIPSLIEVYPRVCGGTRP